MKLIFFAIVCTLAYAEALRVPSVNLKVNNSEDPSQIAQVGTYISMEWTSEEVEACNIVAIGNKARYLFFSKDLSGLETIQLPWVSDRIVIRVICGVGSERVSDEIVVVTYY